MAATVTKVGTTYPKNQDMSFGQRDLVFEVVRVTADGSTATVQCAGATPQTQMVRTPLAVFVTPINQDGATVATYLIYPVISATSLITFTATDSGDQFDALIIGRP